jgi:hypothetical protein
MAWSASLTALSGRWSIASAGGSCGRFGVAELPILEVVDCALVGVPLVLAVVVDKGVGLDAVQPGLQVGALLELPKGLVGLHERFLHEVGRIRGVAREAHRRGVELVHVLQRLFFEQRSWISRSLVVRLRCVTH